DSMQSIQGPLVQKHQSCPSPSAFGPSRSGFGRRLRRSDAVDKEGLESRQSSKTLNQRWAARDELLVNSNNSNNNNYNHNNNTSNNNNVPEADFAMAAASYKKFKTDFIEEASLSRYGHCLSVVAEVLFKLFGVLPFQGNAGCLSPAIVNLILLGAASWPLAASLDDDHHRHAVWSPFNGALMCLGMVMALCCLRRTHIQKLVAPECCPQRRQWVSTIPSDLLPATVFLMAGFSLTSWYLRYAQGQECEIYDSWPLQLSHVVANAVFAVLMFLKLHVLSCLDLMIDDFSRQYAEHGDAEQGILQWSLIQAKLNQASNRLEGSFLMSFTAIVTGFATLTADFLLGSPELMEYRQACAGQTSWLLQPLLMIISKALLLIYVLLRAARISDKCDRTKHFINSLLAPPSTNSSYLDTGRSYLVRYIDDSAAGFCIQGGRITVFAVMNL
ncbi:unnamed protein product, partial [Polarella glacialis]